MVLIVCKILSFTYLINMKWLLDVYTLNRQMNKSLLYSWAWFSFAIRCSNDKTMSTEINNHNTELASIRSDKVYENDKYEGEEITRKQQKVYRLILLVSTTLMVGSCYICAHRAWRSWKLTASQAAVSLRPARNSLHREMGFAIDIATSSSPLHPWLST
jgi:hypothetical protein